MKDRDFIIWFVVIFLAVMAAEIAAYGVMQNLPKKKKSNK